MSFKDNTVVSIIHDRSLRYPRAEDYFSPDETFPEYRLGHISKEPNGIYRAVRQCLANAGLDKENFGKPAWNPLGKYISPGQKVFILCNFVQHHIKGEPEILFAKCTHGSVVRAIIDYVVLALSGRGEVWFGNGPLQSCDWSKVIQETGALRVQEFYRNRAQAKVPVELVDLRQHIVHRKAFGTTETRYHANDGDLCVPVDLGAGSLLEDLYRPGEDPKLRVLDYDPRRTAKCHEKGRHVYLINRRVLDCDVVVSVPKLKTHEKVGMTCGIKGCVGTVGHKDCLAHHRFGPPRAGGDEYPDGLSFLKPFSLLHDSAYSLDPGALRHSLQLLNLYSRKVVRRFTRALSGSWPGNDTCWRMALDLARIVEYASRKGELCSEKQRGHVVFTDGIIGGEGDGPLSPRPVAIGYLSFAGNVVLGDYVKSLAMGFDPENIPMISEAFRVRSYPLAEQGMSGWTVRVNGEAPQPVRLWKGLTRKFLAPKEWRRQLKRGTRPEVTRP